MVTEELLSNYICHEKVFLYKKEELLSNYIYHEKVFLYKKVLLDCEFSNCFAMFNGGDIFLLIDHSEC